MKSSTQGGPEAAHGAPAPTQGVDRVLPRPSVLLSKCLEVEACRYNGQMVRSDLVRRLEPFVELITVCPEVEIGLGVPRDPIRLVQIDGATRLYQPATERDVTDAMDAFADTFLTGLDTVDGAILKSRSPSCGIKDVKVYGAPANAPPVGREAGLFGARVLDRFPASAVEDEGRLRHPSLRAHFLTSIFTRAVFRTVRATGRMRDLVSFHATYKLLFMAYDQDAMRALGSIVANHERARPEAVLQRYGEGIEHVLRRPPRRASVVNVAQHAFGYFSDRLAPAERRYFLDLLERYRTGRAGLASLLAVLGAWIVRFDVSYLATQAFFEPFPRPLAVMDEV